MVYGHLLENLYPCLMDIKILTTLLDQMLLDEPACEPFVQRVRLMARQFQLDALARLLQDTLSQAQSRP